MEGVPDNSQSQGMEISAALPHAQTTRRCDPLPNPALSYLHELLEEDDDAVALNESFLSFGTLFAYREKASELAAILKEDSPTLSLNLSFKTASTMDDRPQQPHFQLPMETLLSANSHVAEVSSSDSLLLTNSLAPPKSLPPAQSCMSMSADSFLNPTLFRKLSASPLQTSQAVEEARPLDRIGAPAPPAVSYSKDEKYFRIDSVLKPRKDAQKSSGKEKISEVFIDLNAWLLECAQAIASSNTKAAMQALIKVKQYAAPQGDGAQRMAFYFAEALEARLAGTGWQIYAGNMRQQRPSSKQIWKASWMYMSSCPFAKAFRCFVNQTILDVAKGASTLHIMEYQFTGFQYPSLFKALAARQGGPPLVRLIAGNVPHYSMVSTQREAMLDQLEQSGRQLTACAASCGVPFHFTAWVGNTGSFKMREYVSPNRSLEEVLVILSVYPLRYINDDLLSPPQKRLQILNTTCAMNPDIFIRGFVSGSYNTPFFSSRFREALYHFECQYEMLDTFIERENTDRIVFESEILGRAVLNVVACEKSQVVERVQRYNQCYAITRSVGFKQVPLNQELKHQVQNILKSWHKDYIVSEDLDYLLMGWRGRMLHALSTWKGLNR